MHRLVRIHAGEGGVVHVADGVAYLDERGADFFLAPNGVLVAGDDDFGLEYDDLLEGANVFDRLADLLAAQGKDVWKLREVGTEEVA
jgi:hypothetical protein